MMKTILQGNICLCGGVWFNEQLPESEPSFCPYCAKKIDEVSSCSDDETKYAEQNNTLPERIKENISKANGQEKIRLITKNCTFCKNEVFFDEHDAPKAHVCPYCAGDLKNIAPNKNEESEIFQDLKEVLLELTGLHELKDQFVSVKVKSWNPFKKAIQYKFIGMDHLSLLLKMIRVDSGHIVWLPLADIKSITELEPC